jgi:hypothetical protein
MMAEQTNFGYFSRQKSPRCLLGGGAGQILGFFGGKQKTGFFVPAITNGNTSRVKYLAN